MLSSHETIPIICQLGLKSQKLIHRSLNLGLVDEAHQLRRIDDLLVRMLRKSQHFDFIGTVSGGKTLLVGEGNLSFALALVRNARVTANQLIASVYDVRDEIDDVTFSNAQRLESLGATVLFGVDATALQTRFGFSLFDTIVFQFPHTGSREPTRGRNPNFALVRDFLRSSITQLKVGGKVMITAVDSPHYHGAFQFEEAAKTAGFAAPDSYPFDPGKFAGYEHTMTHQSGSALGEHDRFRTWVFQKPI